MGKVSQKSDLRPKMTQDCRKKFPEMNFLGGNTLENEFLPKSSKNGTEKIGGAEIFG
ncbi:MAG: hypothetical protein PUB52_08045 [Lachnospiraceae bacterium]|nr:hypothetical protein [Lachnospiraceae bacterium]